MERKKTEKQESPVQNDSKHNKSSENDSNTLDVITEGEVLSEAIDVLQELPKEQKAKLTSGMVVALQQSYRAPIPPAKEMKGYMEVLPTAPDRILKMAEYEQESRIEQKKYETKLTFLFRVIGQLFGFAVSIFFAWGAIKLGMNGHDWLAGTMVGFTLVSLVSVFVISKLPILNNSQKED